MDEEESDWRKQLLVGLGVLVAVALLIGGVVGIIAIKAADVAGIDGSTSTGKDERVTFPSYQPTKTPDSTEPTTPEAPTGSTPPTTTAKPPKSVIKLNASPSSASAYQRVNLTGTYPGAPTGTSLQVQRREGATWTNFSSVTASVNGGSFTTWIETGQPGANRFRVLDAGSGKASNPVTVQIG